MFRWLKRDRPAPPDSSAGPDDRVLALERDLQRLRLEIQERDRSLTSLKAELERHRSGEAARADEAARTQAERLMAAAALPASQLLTQTHLLGSEGKPVEARDVLAVARRLVRVLEDAGLVLEARVGDAVPFDPDRHEPLSAQESFKPGEMVVVKFAGASFRGRVVRKAGVARE